MGWRKIGVFGIILKALLHSRCRGNRSLEHRRFGRPQGYANSRSGKLIVQRFLENCHQSPRGIHSPFSPRDGSVSISEEGMSSWKENKRIGDSLSAVGKPAFPLPNWISNTPLLQFYTCGLASRVLI